MPLISVIIPLYNKEAIIERSVQSVLSQSFKDFELIVVDDGSTDNSAKIVENIQDERIRLFYQENGGPSKARNTGINYAQGEWVLFLDADDELLPNALDKLYEVGSNFSHIDIIDGAYIVRKGNFEKFFPRKDATVKNNFRSFFYREILPSTGHTLFKRELLAQHLYNPNIRRYEDVELIMHLLHVSKIITSSIPVFRVNTDYSSASKARSSIKEDYLGHLNFKHKGFWELMCLYQFYLWERDYYPSEAQQLYPSLHWRFDLLIIYKILLLLRKFHVL